MRDYVPTLTEPVKRWLRFAAILIGSLLLLWLAVYLKEILTPVVAALAAAYILNPVVKLLEQRKIKRVHTIAGIYVVVAVAIGTAVYLLGETAANQMSRLWGWVTQPDNIIRAFFQTTTAPADDGSGLSLLIEVARERGSAIAKGALASIAAIYENVMFWSTAALLFPVCLFYFLWNYDHILEVVRDHLPEDTRDLVVKIACWRSRPLRPAVRLWPVRHDPPGSAKSSPSR